MTDAPAIAFTAKTSLTVTWAPANRPAQQGDDYGGYAGFSYRADVAGPRVADLVSSQTTAGWSVTVTSDVLARQTPCTPASRPSTPRAPTPSPACRSSARRFTSRAARAGQRRRGPRQRRHRGDGRERRHATSYTVTLSDTAHGGAHVATKTVAAAAAVQCSFAGCWILPTSIAAGAAPLASAAATGPAGDYSSPRRPPAPTPRAPSTRPDQPSGSTATVTPGAVAASWSAVAGAASYEVRAVDVHGASPSPAPAIAITATTCAISGGALKDGLVIVLKVREPSRPRRDGALGQHAGRRDRVARPVIAEACFYAPENEIRISWSAVAGASGYHVAVAGTDEHPLTPAPTPSTTSTRPARRYPAPPSPPVRNSSCAPAPPPPA